MASTNIFTIAALCAVFGIGLINAYATGEVPQSFLQDDSMYLLQPMNVQGRGDSLVFKFGNEAERGHKVHSMTASHTISPSKTVTYTGGYPSFFEGSVPKLTYAEITIETDAQMTSAKLYRYNVDEGYAARSLFRYHLSGTNASVFKYKIELFG